MCSTSSVLLFSYFKKFAHPMLVRHIANHEKQSVALSSKWFKRSCGKFPQTPIATLSLFPWQMFKLSASFSSSSTYDTSTESNHSHHPYVQYVSRKFHSRDLSGQFWKSALKSWAFSWKSEQQDRVQVLCVFIYVHFEFMLLGKAWIQFIDR